MSDQEQQEGLVSGDMRRFGIRRVLLAVTSLAIALGLTCWLGPVGYPLAAGITSFWISITLFVLSDMIDPVDINHRSALSWLINVLGIAFFVIFVALSAFGSIVLWLVLVN